MHNRNGGTTQPQVGGPSEQSREMAASTRNPRVTLTLSTTDDPEKTSLNRDANLSETESKVTLSSNDSGAVLVCECNPFMSGENNCESREACNESSWSEPGDPLHHNSSEDDNVCEISGSNIPRSGHASDKVDVKLLLGNKPVDVENGEDNNGLELEAGNGLNSPDAGFEENGQLPAAAMEQNSSRSTLFEDREFDFLRAEPVKRSTSLKTYKTPPGTPKRKAVRFADALGLDLESVRHILNLEDPPLVPKSATQDLNLSQSEDVTRVHESGTPYLAVCFQQPGAVSNFHSRVAESKVLLENCLIRDMSVEGTVRVANIDFHKKVVVRYTTNSWVTFEDVACCYVQNSSDGVTDRFSFVISLPTYFSVGSKVQFAVYYEAAGTTYWDSNNGQNYAIECFARNAPTHPSDRTWMHFL